MHRNKPNIFLTLKTISLNAGAAFPYIFIVGLFIIDFFIPPGTEIGILYLVPLCMLLNKRVKTVYVVAALCCVLILIDTIMSYDRSHSIYIYMDAFLSGITLCVLAFFITRYNRVRMQQQKEKEKITMAVMEMLYITSHKVRIPVTNIQGIFHLKDLENISDNGHTIDTDALVKNQIEQLDNHTRDLTSFLHLVKKEYAEIIPEERLNRHS
jgi:hypothetical protein